MNEIGINVFENFVPTHGLDLHGWLEDPQMFYELIGQVKPKIIIEVGTWKGKSAIQMADVIKYNNLDCKIYCVDTWLGALEFWDWQKNTPERDLQLKNGYPQIYYQFLSNVVHSNHQDIIIPVPLTSNLAAKLLSRKNIKADLIYIDASHETEDVYDDMKNYIPLLNQNGIIFGDDYHWESVKNGVNLYAKDYSCEIEINRNVYWIMKK